MALTEDQKSGVKELICEELPCSTNKTCKEVGGLKTTLRFVILGVVAIIVGLIVNIIIVQSSAKATKTQIEYLQKTILAYDYGYQKR